VRKETEFASPVIIKCLLLVFAITSLVITPFTSLDPIILPRLMIFVPTIFLLLGFVAPGRFAMLSHSERLILSLISLAMLNSFINGDRPPWDLLHGEYRRGNGLFLWTALLAAYLVVRFVYAKRYQMQFLFTFWIVSLLNGIYALFQVLGLDPIPWAIFSVAVGLVGNSNFLTSLVAMSAVSSLPFIFSSRSNKWIRLLSLVQIVLAMFLALSSESTQAMLVLISCTLIYILVASQGWRRLRRRILLTSLGTGLFVIALTLIKSSFATIIYNANSFGQRWDYALAGIRAIARFPLNGLGFDSFSDWYPALRGSIAAARPTAELTDSTHSVLIDLGVNGGIPFLIFTLAFVTLVLIRSFQYLLRGGRKDETFFACTMIFCSFLIQASFSIMHIVLAIWGVAAAGVVMHQLNTSKDRGIRGDRDFGRQRDSQPNLLAAGWKASMTLISTFALFFYVALFIKDAEVRRTLESYEPSKIISISNKWPNLKYHYVFPSLILQESGRGELAVALARVASDIYPRDIDALRVLLTSELVSDAEKREIESKLKSIIPE